MSDNYLVDSMSRYIGQTVTIFTTSGGLSGCGFTGTLAAICGCTVKLITCIGAAPSCALGSACAPNLFDYNNFGYNNGNGYNNNNNNSCHNNCSCGGNSNWLGSVTEIPIDRIASFTHTSI